MTLNDTTETQHNVQLVTGTFSPIEAADVLLSLLTYKIKFHTVQMLSSQEKCSPNTSTSNQRIADLKNAKNTIKDLILKARDEGYELQIESTIKIDLKKMRHLKEI